jgi:hypothetical protein
MIKRNIGTIDRIARLIGGAVFLIIAFLVLDAADAAAGGIVLAVIGALLVMTAVTGYCLGYRLFNYSTIK